MRCECYRLQAPDLIDALVSSEIIGLYTEYIAANLGGFAEQDDLVLMKRCQQQVSNLQAYGFEAVRESHPHDLDQLLTDVFAVASWEGWTLPVSRVADRDESFDQVSLGLLKTGDHGVGALLLWADDEHLLLCRQRERSDDQVRLRPDKNW